LNPMSNLASASILRFSANPWGRENPVGKNWAEVWLQGRGIRDSGIPVNPQERITGVR